MKSSDQKAPSDARVYDVSVVAICRGEQEYMREWLDFHLQIGVSHFYIYDNEPDASHGDLLRPYGAHVTYVHWSDEIAFRYRDAISSKVTFSPKLTTISRQILAYHHCIEEYLAETRWLQLLDIDEYLVPLDGTDITESFSRYDPQIIGRLRVPRYDFGFSGHLWRPKEGCLSAYRRRRRDPSHYKEAGSGYHVRQVDGPHSFRDSEPMVIADNIRVFHFYTRSYSEWIARTRQFGGAYPGAARAKVKDSLVKMTAKFVSLNCRSWWVAVVMAMMNLLLLLYASGYAYGLLLLNIPLGWVFLNLYRKGLSEVYDERAWVLNSKATPASRG